MPVARAEAQAIAEAHIASIGRSVDDGLALLPDQTLTKPYGWVFFYTAKRWLADPRPVNALGGNGPFVVLAATGAIVELGSALPPEDSLRLFEGRPFRFPLFVRDPGPRRDAVLQLVRASTSASAQDALAIVRGDAPVAEGSTEELQAHADALSAIGAHVDVVST